MKDNRTYTVAMFLASGALARPVSGPHTLEGAMKRANELNRDHVDGYMYGVVRDCDFKRVM